MSQTGEADQTVHVSVENIGGISQTDVSIPPGVTILSGENATNRTSFLRSIMAGLGSTNVSLKADSNSGHCEMTIGSETYERVLKRSNSHVNFSGNPYLEDSSIADLFAFLLEDNEARQAVSTNEKNLRSVIMKPIDDQAIQAEIQQYEAKKREIDDKLSELTALKDKLPELKEEETQIKKKIDEKKAELKATRNEIEEAEANIKETKQVKDELEAKLDEVQRLRSSYTTVVNRLETERESVDALGEEVETLEKAVSELPTSVEDERRQINSKLNEVRNKKSNIESQVSELQNLIQFNEDLLTGEQRVINELRSTQGDDDLTAQLVEEETVSCWTCGSEVNRSQINDTIESLRELREEKLGSINNLQAQIEELNSQKNTLEAKIRERQQTERKIEDLRAELDNRSNTIDELEEEKNDLEDEIQKLEDEIDDLEFAEEHDELLDLHQTANRLELEINGLENEYDRTTEEIHRMEDRLEQRNELRGERDEIAEKLTELRTRIERIEKEAVEEFNERIEEVLDIMEYENIERIWIERIEEEQNVTSGINPNVRFELHVVRGGEDGTMYEDTTEHLSESEREVTGLIFALAGYLVHDVHEKVPFMLLDSLEPLDQTRISRLVEYFSDHVDYLVIALLEEDAQALDASYHRIREL